MCPSYPISLPKPLYVSGLTLICLFCQSVSPSQHSWGALVHRHSPLPRGVGSLDGETDLCPAQGAGEAEVGPGMMLGEIF